jgi:hypothetical protein
MQLEFFCFSAVFFFDDCMISQKNGSLNSMIAGRVEIDLFNEFPPPGKSPVKETLCRMSKTGKPAVNRNKMKWKAGGKMKRFS